MNNPSYIPTPHSYSSAVTAGPYTFLGLHRGQGLDFESQIKDTFKHLKQTLVQCGLELNNLVKVHVWLKNINDLPAMEKIFNQYFEENKFPARMTATTQFIDEDCLIMIEGTAYNPIVE